MSNVKPSEFFLFRNYTIAVRDWLRKNIYLSNYNVDNNVTVAFMTPDKAFAKFIYPTINGGTTSPNINFYLSGMEYKSGENSLGFVKQYLYSKNTNKMKEMTPPLVYSLTYSCTVFTRNAAEMDVILYQIISKTSKNAKAVAMVDGQWCEISSSDPSNDTSLEPAERQDIIHRWGLELTIPRAYLPIGGSEVGMITSVEDFDMEMNK